MKQETIGNILSAFFEKKKKDNRRFSVRGLASKLSLSSSYTHQILKGERIADPEVYVRICRFLDIDSERRDYILSQVYSHKGVLNPEKTNLNQKAPTGFSKRKEWALMPRESFKFLNQWFYIPIVESTTLNAYDGTPEFVAQHLGLEVSVVKKAFTDLEQAELLVEKEGRLTKKSEFFDFNSSHNKDEIRAFHKQNLHLAEQALTKTDAEAIEQRLITSFTFTCSDQDVGEIKQKISEFIQSLSVGYPSRKADEVYHFAVQFFPSSQGKKA